MHLIKSVLVALIFIGLSQLSACTNQAAQTANAVDTTFQKLQNELRKEKHKKKVLSRFEVVEGQRGLTLEDISLTLLDYSYHILNDSGRPEPFLTVQCDINISKFEKEAENIKTNLKSTGRRGNWDIRLPDSQRSIIGLIDNEKDEFITFASLPKSVKSTVKFAELRKKKPEYMIITMTPDESCTDCEQVNRLSTAVMGFDEKSKTYYSVLDIKTLRSVEPYDEGKIGSVYDKSTVSWSDWINNEYRELIVSTEREIQDGKGDVKPGFRNKKEIYSWVNDKELSLVERIVDGKSIMNRRGRALSGGSEITLKNGELYEIIGEKAASKITSTGGKISSFLVSPDKHYVVYSIIVGNYKVVGIEGEGDNEPVYNIVVMDLDNKKQLTEIKPQSKNEPFIHEDRWISKEELILYEADGFATGNRYIYHAGDNVLRLADPEEMHL